MRSTGNAPATNTDARTGRTRRRAVLSLAGLITAAGMVLFFSAMTSPAVADTTKPISAKALTSHECNADQWQFVITQVDAQADAPTSIHVTWANSNSEDVPLSTFTGMTAHYRTTDNLDSTVTSATADIYSAWSGQFNLSDGPCGSGTSSSASSSASSSSSESASGESSSNSNSAGGESASSSPAGPIPSGVSAGRHTPLANAGLVTWGIVLMVVGGLAGLIFGLRPRRQRAH